MEFSRGGKIAVSDMKASGVTIFFMEQDQCGGQMDQCIMESGALESVRGLAKCCGPTVRNTTDTGTMISCTAGTGTMISHLNLQHE